MSSSDLLDALKPVVSCLQDLEVRYYLGGSVASSIYGVGRTTLDVDLVADLSIDHIKPLVETLQGTYYVGESMIHEAVKHESCFNVIHLETMFKVDIFVCKKRAFDQSAINRIRKDTVGVEDAQTEVFVASPEDVILNKLEWYRKGGEVAQRQWDDVIGVLKVQEKLLDYDYLHKWAEELAVLDLLEGAISQASQ